MFSVTRFGVSPAGGVLEPLCERGAAPAGPGSHRTAVWGGPGLPSLLASPQEAAEGRGQGGEEGPGTVEGEGFLGESRRLHQV